MNEIIVGNVRAENAKKAAGYLHVEGAATQRTFVCNPFFGPPRPRTVAIPIMIVNGSNPGPKLCILSGTHPCEYPPIDAAIRMYNETDPTKLKGALLIVPVLNVAAFWSTTPYLNPDDNLDISILYKVEGGSISHLIAKSILENVLTKSDYVLELHGGDILEDVVPHTEYELTGDSNLDSMEAGLAKTYGLRFVVETAPPLARPSIGRPRIVAEAGREGRLEEEFTSMHLRGIRNVMKRVGMIDGAPILPADQLVVRKRYEIFCETAGMFYPSVKVGDMVTKGQLLGTIKNIQGQVAEELTAPHDSAVKLVMTNPVKLPYDMIFKCWLT